MQPHEANPPVTGAQPVTPLKVAPPNGTPPSIHVGHSVSDQDVAARETDHSGHTPIHPRPGTGVRILVGAALLGIGLLAVFLFVSHQRALAESALQSFTSDMANAPVPVNVTKVQYGAGSLLVPLPGECRPWNETTIYSRVNGYVKNWFVDIGDHVKQGDVLATIETPELDQQLASEQAKADACKAQIELAKANVHFSETTLARFKDAPKGIVSDLERDERAADYQTSQAKLTAAQSDLNSAQAGVDQLKATIAFQKVVAPFDGVITQRHVDIGNLVTSGSTANTTSLFSLAQSDQMRIFVDVPESAAPDIHEGEQAIATADEFPGRQFVGHVSRTSRAISDAAKTLRVEVDTPNKDSTLLPGMFVRVNFEVKATEHALMIPASALNFRSGGPQVATVDGEGRVTFRDVTIGRDLGDTVEIKSGVKADDRVVLNISYQIADGDIVKPIDSDLPGVPPSSTRQASVPTDASKPLTLNAH